jgi:hypothetical protein
MLAKDAAGQYQTQLGFPALGWTALPAREQGWPDLSFGGPGFCHAVWAWNGDAYAFKCNLPETEGGCTNPASTC